MEQPGYSEWSPDQSIPQHVYWPLLHDNQRWYIKGDWHIKDRFAVIAALANFETEISPWRHPNKWLHDDEEDIFHLVQGIVTSLRNDKYVVATLERLIIYRVS
jgi:hypothetical protein